MRDNERPLCGGCGDREARVFDPDGSMWCRECEPPTATEAGDPEAWVDPELFTAAILVDPQAAAWHANVSELPDFDESAATSDDADAGHDPEQTDDDPVNHPSHYTQGPPCPGCGRTIECIDVTRGMGFDLGNAVKYVWRCDLKHDAIEDLRKAVFYIKDEIARREGQSGARAINKG